MRRALAVLVAMYIGTACERPEADDAGAPDAATPAETPATNMSEVATTYAPELLVDLSKMTRTASGLYMQDVKEGTGEPIAAGRVAVVHYTGWTSQGMQFDTSRDSGQPIEFVLGTRTVIDGWDEGVAGMKPGGQRRLVIPPALGYPSGSGPIPPGATLVFDVELVEIK